MRDFEFKNCFDPSIKCQKELFPDINYDVLVDLSILLEDHGEVPSIAWVVESPEIVNLSYMLRDPTNPLSAMEVIKRKMETGNHNFSRLYTYDKTFEGLPNTTVVPFVPAPTWIEPENIRVHEKTKLVSLVASAKSMTPFQIKRVMFSKHISDNNLADCYGRGTKSPIDKKSDALIPYCFSYVTENGVSPYYFTEKILDCFLTGTIPLYAGDPKIGEVFDERGIIKTTDGDKLFVIENLSFELYEKMLPYVKSNYKIAKAIKNRPQDIFQQIYDYERTLPNA